MVRGVEGVRFRAGDARDPTRGGPAANVTAGEDRETGVFDAGADIAYAARDATGSADDTTGDGDIITRDDDITTADVDITTTADVDAAVRSPSAGCANHPGPISQRATANSHHTAAGRGISAGVGAAADGYASGAGRAAVAEADAAGDRASRTAPSRPGRVSAAASA